jgi:ribose 5-phosphate isomerase B
MTVRLAGMRVYLASDHAGFEMKNHLLRRLDELGHEVRDLGAAEFDPDDALAWSTETACLAREHNDARIVAIGARMHTLDEASEIITSFVDTPFSGDRRHLDRIAMLDRYEESGQPPPLHER